MSVRSVGDATFMTVPLGTILIGSTKVLVEERQAESSIDKGTWDDQGAFIMEDDGTCVIVISGALPEPLWSRVLLHEVIHAASELFGLDLSEQTVRTLEQVLPQSMSFGFELIQPLTTG